MADSTTPRDRRRSSGLIPSVGRWLAGLLVSAALLAGSVQAATVTVAAINFRFQPESRTINTGDVVRWTFSGDPHTVTSGAPGSPDGRFDSGIEDPGGSFQVTFATAGSFPYFCQIHPEQMFGTIVVESGATAPPTPKPTAKPTPNPTPTTRPTARPTARPSATQTAAPAATPTTTPAPTVAPTVPPTAAPTPTPTLPAASESPSASPTPDDAPAGSLDVVPILAIALVVGLLVAGGVALAQRGRTG